MNLGTRRSRTAPHIETLKGISDFVVRRTAGMVSGGLRCDFAANLSEDEQTELVALTREAERGGGSVLDRLSKKKQARWERLVGKGGGDPSFFANARELENIRTLASEAHVAAVRRPFRRTEESGLLAELGRQFAGGFLTATCSPPSSSSSCRSKRARASRLTLGSSANPAASRFHREPDLRSRGGASRLAWSARRLAAGAHSCRAERVGHD